MSKLSQVIDLHERMRNVQPLPTLPSGAEARRIREGAALSQEAVAQVLGVSWRSVGRYERGEATPTLAMQLPYRQLLAALAA